MLKGKKVLLFGLGILGGGLAIAKFCLKNGADLTITDSKTEKDLAETIKKLPKKFLNNGSIKFKLGGHSEQDIIDADIVIFNQSVPFNSPWVEIARKHDKPFYDDLTLFYGMIKSRAGIGSDGHLNGHLATKMPKISAVTGTRGKTTTTNWIGHFLGKNTAIGGNMPENALLKIIDSGADKYALELSSFQLEYALSDFAPNVALITNLYRDHLNRYGVMKKYALEKAKIFLNQSRGDFLILNADNDWSDFFIKQKPRAKIFWFSLKKLKKGLDGIYLMGDKIFLRDSVKYKKDQFILDAPFVAKSANQNLLGAFLSAYLITGDYKKLIPKIKNLPQIRYRQEVIENNRRFMIVNDGAATSPDGTIALLDAYRKIPKGEKFLITGGTDKNLDYREWGNIVSHNILPEQLFFINGSATEKMIFQLRRRKFFNGGLAPAVFENFSDLVNFLKKKINSREEKKFDEGKKTRQGKPVIMFSPSSASFEKFRNEFDRLNQFEKNIKKL